MRLDCGHQEFESRYGIALDGKTYCYDCCAEREKQYMWETGEAVLYLVQRGGEYYVIDWPGRLSIPVGQISKGKHNWAGTRYDVWFNFEGTEWHGVQYGESTQLCHCRRVTPKKEEK